MTDQAKFFYNDLKEDPTVLGTRKCQRPIELLRPWGELMN